MKKLVHEKRIINMLLGYRWASLLLPALWLIFPPAETAAWPVWPGWLLALATASTILVTFLHPQLNKLLPQRPYLLAIDLLFSAFLVLASGSTQSPYYLFALSPLMVGAFYFRLRGGLVTAAVFTVLYLPALFFGNSAGSLQVAQLINQLTGIWLLAGVFGYVSLLLGRLEQARDELREAQQDLSDQNDILATSNRRLSMLHELTLLLQSAPDIRSVQEQVTAAVISELGFQGAAVGLVKPGDSQLGDWCVRTTAGLSWPDSAPVGLDERENPIIQSILQQHLLLARRSEPTGLNGGALPWAKDTDSFILPLSLHGNPIGALVVAAQDESEELGMAQTQVLEMITNQAAVSLGTTMLCIDKAQQLAVEQERNRIARDIHDTASQSLFGIAFTLDACIQMLPDKALEVRGELLELQGLANRVRTQLRNSILDLWPSNLTLRRFKADLYQYINENCFSGDPFAIHFKSEGNFDQLTPSIRRSLYRISQEGLMNVVRHAAVREAWLDLDINQKEVELSIRDQGSGFDPQAVLSREQDRERFGLHGIQERVEMIGGECRIRSKAGRGSQLRITIPLSRQFNHA